MAVDIYQGSFNADRFNEFVEHRVLPLCHPGYTVLVLDNCNIHRSTHLRELCDAADIDIAFLPPYSPDFNPIEETFHALKQWMRRNRELARTGCFAGDFEGFIWHAVEHFREGRDARGYYRNARIG